MLATGSAPFVPPVPGIDKTGVFVYRTIEDLERSSPTPGTSKTAAVIGGGLLGLEAAKAAYDLGLETHVVEFAPRLMPRQVDDAGSQAAGRQDRGARRPGPPRARAPRRSSATARSRAWRSPTAAELDVDMIVVSAGIRPRDELARACGLTVGERGGIVVDDQLRTSRSRTSSPSARSPCTAA